MDITMVLHMDGFSVNSREFYCRELAMIQLGSDRMPVSFTFDLSELVFRNREMRSISHCTQYVHGLPLNPYWDESFLMPIGELETMVSRFYTLSGNSGVVACIGQYDTSLLRRLNIPAVDLKSLGMPRFDLLRHSHTHDCGLHVEADRGTRIICTTDKVVAARDWLLEQQ